MKQRHDVVGSTFHFPAFWFSGQRSTQDVKREKTGKRGGSGKEKPSADGQVINLGADTKEGDSTH